VCLLLVGSVGANQTGYAIVNRMPPHFVLTLVCQTMHCERECTMNGSIETAQKRTGKTTAKQLIAVIKTAPENCGLFGYVIPARESWEDSFIFEMKATKGRSYGSKGPETITSIEVPGYVSNGNISERADSVEHPRYSNEAYRPVKGYWSLHYNEDFLGLLKLLPGDAEVAFCVALDAGTHAYLIQADSCPGDRVPYKGLHCDLLYLYASWESRGKRVMRRFLIDEVVVPHNSARFGTPRHELDKVGRE
jgi:hypothetical protein